MRLFIAGILTLSLVSSVWMITLSPILPDDMDYHMKFIYINEKVFSYNEATKACAILNATLMTMRSWQKWYIVQQLYNSTSDWNMEATEEAWIGLTNTIYGYNWIDCVSLDFNTFSLFKDAGSMEFKASEQCFRVKEGENFKWKRKKCSDDLGAICEQRIHGGSCQAQDLLTGDLIDNTGDNEDNCASSCDSEESCYAIIHYQNGTQHNCIRMKKTSSVGPHVNVKIKQCITGEIKYASDITTGTTIPDNESETPEFTCSNTIAFHTNAATSAISTVTPSTVDEMMYTSCFNITVTTTLMSNFTTYIPQTAISYVHSLFTATMTTMVPTTVVSTTTLAPSTVTVEVTPSLTTCQERTTFINITNTKYIEEAVENITKALYVDKKQISSYVRSKTCAEDNRSSSATVGYFGIVFIAVPFALIFLLDLRSICAQMRDTAKHCQPCAAAVRARTARAQLRYELAEVCREIQG